MTLLSFSSIFALSLMYYESVNAFWPNPGFGQWGQARGFPQSGATGFHKFGPPGFHKFGPPGFIPSPEFRQGEKSPKVEQQVNAPSPQKRQAEDERSIIQKKEICADECVNPEECIEGFVNIYGVFKTDPRLGVSKSSQVCANNEVCCKMPETSEEVYDPDADITEPIKQCEPCGNGDPEFPPNSQPIRPVKVKEEPLQCGRQVVLLQNKISAIDEDAAETQEGDFPWMLNIKKVIKSSKNSAGYETALCGGTLISAHAGVSAAHCFDEQSLDNIVISAGLFNLAGAALQENVPQDRLLSRAIIHPQYSKRPIQFDIAMIFFNQPFALTPFINPICLPKTDADLKWEYCVATGWGKRPENSDANDRTLKKAVLPMISAPDCITMLRKNWLKSFRLHKTSLCAGGETGIDTCSGDGGGPLTCPHREGPKTFYLTGITSWGTSGGCGQPGRPGIYTNVTFFYDWINEKLLQHGRMEGSKLPIK